MQSLGAKRTADETTSLAGDRDSDSKRRPADTKRLQRKKQREKKQVTKGIGDLHDILVEVDPVLRADRERTNRIHQLDPKTAENAYISINRVALIERATSAIERLYQENQQQKLMIDQLSLVTQRQSSTLLGQVTGTQFLSGVVGSGIQTLIGLAYIL